jgi:hypothetical protein
MINAVLVTDGKHSGKAGFCPSSILTMGAYLNLDETPFSGNVDARIVTPTFFTQSLGLESVAMIDVS